MYQQLFRCTYRNAGTTFTRNYAKFESGKEKYQKKVSSLKKYWFSRYVDYIKNYEDVLAKNFPKTMHVYRVFSIGTKDLYQDLKKYLSVIRKSAVQGTNNLTREELELSYTMPKDLLKISPLLLLSAVPFTNYIIFPLAYFFPRTFLTSQYWSLQQRVDFAMYELKKRLKHNKPLFRCIQAELQSIRNHALKAKWGGIMACLGSGTHPFPEDVIYCQSLFVSHPYSLDCIKRKHVRELLAIHGISKWRLFKRRNLLERGIFIKKLDDAIRREGIGNMSNEAMRWNLFLRGANPANMSTESMMKWLETWILVSSCVDEKSISLLLHCPILLAYNHPTNWTLLHRR